MKKLLLALSAIILLAAGCNSYPKAVNDYDQCIKQGGELGVAGSNNFCAIDGKSFPRLLYNYQQEKTMWGCYMQRG